MAESSTVTILRNKVEEIDARIRAYEREIEIARKNLVAVQMTLAVFQTTEGDEAKARHICRDFFASVSSRARAGGGKVGGPLKRRNEMRNNLLKRFLRRIVLDILEDKHSAKYPSSASKQLNGEYERSITLPVKIVQDRWNRQEEEHREKEKNIWDISWKTSLWTAIAASIAAIFAGLAYREAKRQADIAQSALDSSDRPWVVLKDLVISGPLAFDEAGNASIEITPIVMNAGRSPSVYTSTHVRMAIKAGYQNALDQQKSDCYPVRSSVAGGDLVAPNELSSAGTYQIIVPKAEIGSIGPEKAILPLIYGCIRYMYGQRYRYSGFAYIVTGLPTGELGKRKEIVIGKDTPANMLSLTKFPTGFFAE